MTPFVEILDGALYLTPARTPRRQHIARRLADALDTTESSHVLATIRLRLTPHCIPIPDVVVTHPIDSDSSVVDAQAALLVCEIFSPPNAAVGKVLKSHHYAASGIPWYLLVDEDTGALHLHRLEDQHYVEHSTAFQGEALHLEEPVKASIVTAELLPPR